MIDIKQPKTARNILALLSRVDQALGYYQIDRCVSMEPDRDTFFAPNIALKDLARAGLVEEGISPEGRVTYQITEKGRETLK